MDTLIITAATILMVMGGLYLRGNRIIKLQEEKLEKIAEQRGKDMDMLGRCSYHGGFPQIPKPQKLTTAMTDNDLILLTGKGQVETLPLDRWQEIDMFSTHTKPDRRKRSVILWGPFNQMFSSDQRRHFIVIKYQDSDDLDNHLLIEYAGPDESRITFEKLKAGWNQYISRFGKGAAALSRLSENDPR
jgi:hypothetical protein